MKVNFYQVGGAVRDEILGVPSKDIDYAVEILDPPEKAAIFDVMYEAVKSRGGEVVVSTPQYMSLKARFPEPLGTPSGARFIRTEVSDFTLCRKDGHYYDGRHPVAVFPGTILDDLARRDFTVNALAKTEDGKIIDPHDGMRDIRGKSIRCVGRTDERLAEDGLRMLRAIRFVITRGFSLSADIGSYLLKPAFYEAHLRGVTPERVREELSKCFYHDTLGTLNYFDLYRTFRNYVFKIGGSRAVWLRPTLEGRPHTHVMADTGAK